MKAKPRHTIYVMVFGVWHVADDEFHKLGPEQTVCGLVVPTVSTWTTSPPAGAHYCSDPRCEKVTDAP